MPHILQILLQTQDDILHIKDIELLRTIALKQNEQIIELIKERDGE